VVVIELLADELEDLRHELHLVELGGRKQANHKFDEAVDEAIVKGVIVEAPLTEFGVLG